MIRLEMDMKDKFNLEIDEVASEIKECKSQIEGFERRIEEILSKINQAGQGPEQLKLLEKGLDGLLDDKKHLWKHLDTLEEEKENLIDQRFLLFKGKSQAVEWDEDQVLRCLLHEFKEEAVRARSKQPPDPIEDDLGQQFDILGRKTTFDVLLKGTGVMYKRFLKAIKGFVGYQRDKPFFFALIAFPGAGKTTLGVRGWPFLSANWSGLKEEEKRQMLDMLTVNELQRFEAMCEASLKHNLCMYHRVSHVGGGLLEEETGLSGRQILGLRCLAAILAVTDYQALLVTLNSKFPGLIRHVSFSVVLRFLRDALGVSETEELLVPFFFDEVNQVTRDMNGRDVESALRSGEKVSTWFQEVMSAYVQEEHKLALAFQEGKAKVFPIFSVASTRFSAADLKFTASAKPTALPVPFHPLSTDDSRDVVLNLLGRWACDLQQPKPTSLPESTQYIIDVSGGMPRVLSRGLEALCGSTEDLSRMFQRCTTNMGLIALRRAVQNWQEELAVTYFSDYYRHEGKAEVLMRALAVSLLVRPVTRKSSVLPTGTFANITYGDLESSGLLALSPVNHVQEIEDAEDTDNWLVPDKGVTDLGSAYVLARCSPFLVWSLIYSLDNEMLKPCFIGVSSKKKEPYDLTCILFRIYVMQKSFGEHQFRLEEVFPGAYVSQKLKYVQLELACNSYRIHEQRRWIRDRTGFQTMREEAGEDCCVYLGCGNECADGYLIAKSPDGHEIPIVVQSRSTSTDNYQGFAMLVRNFVRDMRWFKLLKIPEETIESVKGVWQKVEYEQKSKRQMKRKADEAFYAESEYERVLEVCGKYEEEPQKLEPLDFIYVYITNRPISEQFKLSLRAAQEVVPYFDHVVLAYECEARIHGDALSILNGLRRWKQLFGE